MLVIEYIIVGALSAIGWWGANYYVITPHLPEPVFAEKKEEPKKQEKTEAKLEKNKSNNPVTTTVE